MKLMRRCIILFFVILFAGRSFSHPLPSSVVKLSVFENKIKGEAKMPSGELANALARDTIRKVNDAFFNSYFKQHISAATDGRVWLTSIENVNIVMTRDSMIGNYPEVVVHFTMTPQRPDDLSGFIFNYNAIVHQVVTHKVLVYIEQDWANGIQNGEGGRQVGIIKMNLSTEKVDPMIVNLEKGSNWKGFLSMVNLGMQHIKEGTDHLLFLLVLILPSMLITSEKKWKRFAGVRHSVNNLLRIVTAFTLGHSITLFLGALGVLCLPLQPIEVLISISIMVSAIHAIYPIFPRREAWIAAGFGLIHGMAFAAVLTGLDLSAKALTLSILGFNLGIEIMQLTIILLIVPWLILLSLSKIYSWIRIPGAILAGLAAVCWTLERISGEGNFFTRLIDSRMVCFPWLLGVLAVFSVLLTIGNRLRQQPSSSTTV